MRRSEVSALRWADVADGGDADSILVIVRRSKTNQGGETNDVRYLKDAAARAGGAGPVTDGRIADAVDRQVAMARAPRRLVIQVTVHVDGVRRTWRCGTRVSMSNGTVSHTVAAYCRRKPTSSKRFSIRSSRLPVSLKRRFISPCTWSILRLTLSNRSLRVQRRDIGYATLARRRKTCPGCGARETAPVGERAVTAADIERQHPEPAPGEDLRRLVKACAGDWEWAQ